MKKGVLISAALMTAFLFAHAVPAKSFTSVRDIRKAGRSFEGKVVQMKLSPKSIIVVNGVLSLADPDGGVITLRVPPTMEKKIRKLNTGLFYTFTVRIESASGNSLRGYIITFGD